MNLVNNLDSNGQTHLHIAISRKNVSMVETGDGGENWF